MNWGADMKGDAGSNPKFGPHLEVPEGQTARLGEDRGVVQASEPDADEAPAEAGAAPRPRSGQQCSLHTCRPGWLGPVRGPEAPPQPPVRPQTQPYSPSSQSGAAHSQEQLWVQPGTGGPSLCREVPPNPTILRAKDWTERPSSWAWGIPWGPWPREGARPRSANTTDPQLEGGLSCPENPAWVKLPSALVLGGLQEAPGLGRTRPENWELEAVIWAAVYARRAQQTFTTLPPARGLTRPPHPSRTRELGAGRRGGPGWSRAQARQDRVTWKGQMGCGGRARIPRWKE